MWRRTQFPLVAALSLQFVKEGKKEEEPLTDERFPTNAYLINNKHDKLKGRLELFRHRWGIPGLCFMASVNGVTHFTTCIGHRDVENSISCDSSAVMRIASISKPMTAVAILKLWEEGKLDLHKPIHEYVKSFPVKSYEGVKVDITTYQLLSHTAGIRSYKMPSNDTNRIINIKEMLIRDNYSVAESLKLFQDDKLVAKPGSGTYVYSTHGWTVLSAVIEGITNSNFLNHMCQELFEPLNMTNTVADHNDALIINRSRHYRRDDKGVLLNTPYVDLSYKWAGGGYMSTVEDLAVFGNALLLSYNQHQRRTKGMKTASNESKFILKPSTVDMMWTPVATDTGCNYSYGLGWTIAKNSAASIEQCDGENDDSLIVYHSGGTVGASSILVIIPGTVSENDDPNKPKGVVVVLLANLQEVVEIEKLGKSIALKLHKNATIVANPTST